MMQLTATGTAINFNQGVAVPFSLDFVLTGGRLETAGCDSALVNAHVTDFSAVIGGQPFAAPSSFLANFMTSPYPTCSGPHYIEITNVASGNSLNWLTLEWEQFPSDPGRHSMFSGNIGEWYVANAHYDVVNSVPEPGTLSLVAVALIAAVLVGKRRRSSRTRAITSA